MYILSPQHIPTVPAGLRAGITFNAGLLSPRLRSSSPYAVCVLLYDIHTYKTYKRATSTKSYYELDCVPPKSYAEALVSKLRWCSEMGPLGDD